ncbi:hypothetical protein ANN_08248 [Periplaneta americana]|uniref:Uncharacterized protein n=1 Tax=Periplaneta americana TaxID=6978 RepID=A0ABQ8T0W8_PERAM|nr:hypothetical protein ANN_08248 [Periplaneta americana]
MNDTFRTEGYHIEEYLLPMGLDERLGDVPHLFIFLKEAVLTSASTSRSLGLHKYVKTDSNAITVFRKADTELLSCKLRQLNLSYTAITWFDYLRDRKQCITQLRNITHTKSPFFNTCALSISNDLKFHYYGSYFSYVVNCYLNTSAYQQFSTFEELVKRASVDMRSLLVWNEGYSLIHYRCSYSQYRKT